MPKKSMKKIISFVVAILMLAGFQLVSNFDEFFETEQTEIKLINCIDGDTAKFSEIGKTRFLFIDTPESTNEIEEYGHAAAQYTCNKLKNAQKITYEYDGSKTDQYDRTLAWIFVDGKLLQEEIAQAGYVKKFYNYTDFRYEKQVRNALNDKYHIFQGEK